MKYYENCDGRPVWDKLEEEDIDYGNNMRPIIETIIGVKDAEVLYDRFGSTNNILKADQYMLVEAGIAKTKAERLIAARNLRYETESKQVRCSKDAYDMVRELSDSPTEHFIVLIFNRAHKLLKKIELSKGGTAGTVVDTKVLFHEVLKTQIPNAIVLVHNHPSGNLQPSQSDIELTKKIVAGALLMDIKVLDHIIIAASGYFSFMDEGYL